MQSVTPATGAPETTLDPEGKVFLPLPVAVYRDLDNPKITVIVSRWQPSDEERAAIAAGEDIYVAQLTDTNSVSALRVRIGAGEYQVSATEVEVDPTYDVLSNETIPTDSEGAE